MAAAAMEIDPSMPSSVEDNHQTSDPHSVDATVDAASGQQENAIAAGEKRKREAEEEEKGDEEKEGDSGRKPMWKTSLCSYYRRRQQGGVAGCSHGDACRYAHGEAELRPRPDNTWDPTSERAKKLLRSDKSGNDAKVESLAARAESLVEVIDMDSLDKCLIGLPKKWASDNLKSFLDDQGILFKAAKKKKGMNLGFVKFENTEQLTCAIKALTEKSSGGKQIKLADAIRRSHEKKPGGLISSDQSKAQNASREQCSDEPSMSTMSGLGEEDDCVERDTSVAEGVPIKTRSARDVVTPLADMPYEEQLEQKRISLVQILKKLTRNARKACPAGLPLPEWINKSRDIGGLPCKLEGILGSPLTNGYRNKCEFSVGYSTKGERTVGFMVGNFREGITAVEEPINCPNVSRISCEFAFIFQDFLRSSVLNAWDRIENKGFWRQFTVREGRAPGEAILPESEDNQIAEVMLIIQVCSLGVDEELMKSEFEKMSETLAHGAASRSPPLPLTTIIVQDHTGISNAAPADCHLIPLLVPKVDGHSCSEKKYIPDARIHDHISNLRFSISPTAFFQVNTLAAERLYSLAGDWADLSPDTLLFDICCGTGTIGLSLAHRVGMVVGVEMNESAVSDAKRNALVNGIKNCRFICGKAEDVIGALLKEYLDVPQQHDIVSNLSLTNCTDNDSIVDGMADETLLQSDTGASTDILSLKTSFAEMSEEELSRKVRHGENHEGHSEESSVSEFRLNKSADSIVNGMNDETPVQSDTGASTDILSLKTSFAEMSEEELSRKVSHGENLEGHTEESSVLEFWLNKSADKNINGSGGVTESCRTGCSHTSKENLEGNDLIRDDCSSRDKKGASPDCQFKDIVAIVDPPRVGLHPVVLKALRTHPRIRRLVYISCNPQSLVANAIELCTPTVDKMEKGKGNKQWRNMGSAGLARHRLKSMPNSEPFRPVRAMAVDLFPHTSHCEMVMLLER